MTHATDFFIKEPADAEIIWQIAVDVLASYSDKPASDFRYTSEAGKYRGNIGQGYASILYMDYAIDAPVERTRYAWSDVSEDYAEIGLDLWSFKFDFDTGYSFSRNGLGCVEVHLAMIRDILTRMGIEFGRTFTAIFDNEQTGDWYSISSDNTEPQWLENPYE